jgi:DNA-binding transcriptional regulator LsrR (DeoR family)
MDLTLQQARDLLEEYADEKKLHDVATAALMRKRSERVIAAYSAGLNKKEIAQRIGLSRKWVTDFLAAATRRGLVS